MSGNLVVAIGPNRSGKSTYLQKWFNRVQPSDGYNGVMVTTSFEDAQRALRNNWAVGLEFTPIEEFFPKLIELCLIADRTTIVPCRHVPPEVLT